MPKTMAEKILSKASPKEEIEAGEIIIANIDKAMIHDITGPLAIDAYKKIGTKKLWSPEKIITIFDHQVPADSINAAKNHIQLRKFVNEEKIPNFYDIKEGVCHQVLPEKGHILPGELIVGTDSHTCTHGALGAFATGIGSTDMAMVFATGKLWLKVPETIQFNIKGTPSKHTHAKDIILHIIGKMGADGTNYKACEFTGPTTQKMTISDRMVLCNMAIEMGGKTGIIQADQKTEEYLKNRTNEKYEILTTDSDAKSLTKININIEELEPQIACPHNVDNVKPISQVEGTEIDQVFIGSCTNGRISDLRDAANILKGKEINPKTRMLVIPASRETYKKALDEGLIKIFIESGALVTNPCCGPCLGGHVGLLGPGEVGLATSNRNFKGREGSSEAEIYLSSSEVAAASAITGKITHPTEI